MGKIRFETKHGRRTTYALLCSLVSVAMGTEMVSSPLRSVVSCLTFRSFNFLVGQIVRSESRSEVPKMNPVNLFGELRSMKSTEGSRSPLKADDLEMGDRNVSIRYMTSMLFLCLSFFSFIGPVLSSDSQTT